MDIMAYYKTMVDALLHPTAAFKANKDLGLMEGLTYAALAGILVGLINAVLTMGVRILGIITTPIAAIVSAIIIGAILWIIAKALGMKKSIGNFIGVYAFLAGAIALITWIPVIGGVLALYWLYLFYKMLTVSMGMSSTNAIITILIPLVIVAILVMFFAAVLLAFLGGTAGGLLGGAGGSLLSGYLGQ